MARFRPYVNAVQWTGTNVIEIRQFVASSPTMIKSAVIRNGILFLEAVIPATIPPALVTPDPIPVPVNGWVVISVNALATIDDPAQFAATYEPDL